MLLRVSFGHFHSAGIYSAIHNVRSCIMSSSCVISLDPEVHVSDTDEMSAIRQIEKGRHDKVDNLLNIFMKGCAAESPGEHLITDFMLRELDLEPCQDTLVGNDFFRGVSGGQRKRVSAGCASQVLLWGRL